MPAELRTGCPFHRDDAEPHEEIMLLGMAFHGLRYAGGRRNAAMTVPDERSELTYEQHMELKERLLLYLQHTAYVKLEIGRAHV